MKPSLTALFCVAACAAAQAQTARVPDNPLIDAPGFIAHAVAADALRKKRRVSEADFMRMAREPGTVILDARSERMFRLRHVAGAVNLSFTEFTPASLAHAIPSKQTRILIYCNNNFVGAPESLATKAPAAALNLSTFAALYSYGYRNVYELAPVIDVKRAKLAFAGDEVR